MIHDAGTNNHTLIATCYRRFTRSVRDKRWQWAGGLIIGIVIYAYIAVRLWHDWSTLDLSAFQFRYSLLALSCLAQGGGTLVAIWTWMILLREMGYPIPFTRHVKVYTMSNLARRLPGFGWWVVGRAYMYDRDGVGKLETSAGAMLEMVLTTTAALCIAILTMAVSGTMAQNVSPFVLLALLTVLVSVLHPQIFALVRRRLRVSEAVPPIKWPQLLLLLACQGLVVALGGLALYWMLAAIHNVAPAALFGVIQGWALTIVSLSMLFWLPIDFGLSSGLLVLILGTFLPLPVALVSAIAWRFWVGVCELLWALLSLLLPSPRREAVGRQSPMQDQDAAIGQPEGTRPSDWETSARNVTVDPQQRRS